jgi:hypothetical protein
MTETLEALVLDLLEWVSAVRVTAAGLEFLKTRRG